MVEILKETNDKLIATKASDKLTEKDYDKILPIVHEALEKHDKVNWFFEMDQFKGWEFKAFWKDLKMDLKHGNEFGKIAMVGDKNWEKTLSKLMDPFTTAEVKYFEAGDKEKAMDWVKSE